MSYTNLLYHIVYATKERAPLITETLRPRLHEYLGGTVRGLDGIALEVNGVTDHVHILAKLRPTISVSEFLSKLKSGSSSWAKRQTASACDVTFVTRKSIIASIRSKKNSKRCCVRTTLILTPLICGDNSVASCAGSFDFSDGSPGSAAPRQGLYSAAC